MDLFESSDYVITGKHSDMLRRLVNVWTIFPTYVSVLPVAAIIGLLMDITAKKDLGTGSAKIQYAQLVRYDEIILKSFQLIILNEPSERKAEDRINRLFRQETVSPEDKELFNSYIRGGIEYLDASISADSEGYEDDSHRMLNVKKMVDEIDWKNGGCTVESVLENIKS